MHAKLALTLVVLLASSSLVSCSDDASTLERNSSGSSSGGTSGGTSGTSSGGTSGDPGSSSGGTSGTTTGAGGSAAEICVATINEYRKTKGLPPYTRWSETESCADDEAKSDATTKKPHGAFGKCQEFGQNECPGWPGPPETMIPKCLKAMWGEGPGGGHYEAMASTKFTKVACGFGAAGGGAIWSVQNFR